MCIGRAFSPFGSEHVCLYSHVAERSLRGDLDGIMLKANPQVFHLGKQRLDAVKLTAEKIKKGRAWIEANMRRFVAALPQPTGRHGSIQVA
jgi:hypothetical protein